MCRPCRARIAPRSVAVVVRLVRAFDRHADVVSLFFGEHGELHADLLQVQAGDFFVELLREAVDSVLALVLVRSQVELGEALVRETVRRKHSDAPSVLK